MPQPPSGKVQTPLQGNRSQQNPSLAFSKEFIVNGTLEVDLGTFAPLGRTINSCPVACLAQAPVAGAASVSVSAGSKPNTVLVSVWTSTFTASSTNTKINLIATIGSSVGK